MILSVLFRSSVEEAYVIVHTINSSSAGPINSLIQVSLLCLVVSNMRPNLRYNGKCARCGCGHSNKKFESSQFKGFVIPAAVNGCNEFLPHLNTQNYRVCKSCRRILDKEIKKRGRDADGKILPASFPWQPLPPPGWVIRVNEGVQLTVPLRSDTSILFQNNSCKPLKPVDRMLVHVYIELNCLAIEDNWLSNHQNDKQALNKRWSPF